MLPEHVTLVEVGPRDGLQSVDTALEPAERIELIRRLARGGAARIEAVSFVHPRLVPQMAKAEAVAEGLADLPASVSLIGLVLNQRGLERALATAVHEVNFVVAAADGYSRSNQGTSVEEAMAAVEAMVPEATSAGRFVTVTISVAFGDPYDGEVSPERVVELAARSVAAGAGEVALGDTIGVAVPIAVTALIEQLRGEIADTPIRCHFHDTRRAGLANVMAALQAGVTVFDTSVGGLGGSPFAPAAGGNVATEDAVAFLERMGVATGIDLERTVETGRWLGERVGTLPAALQHAPPWPPRVGESAR